MSDIKKRRKSEVTVFEPHSEWLGATLVEEKQSSVSTFLIYFLCASLVLATLCFGLVDGWSLALLCAGAGVIGWLWLADAWTTGALRFSKSALTLPFLGLIFIGLFQLLPLRTVQLPAGMLTQPASGALSLDAFATRLAVAQLAAMFVYFFAALTFINNQKRLRIVTMTIVIFGFLLAVFGIVQFFSGGNQIYWMRDVAGAKPFGPFVNRHHFAALMEMTLGLTLGLIYTGAVEREQRSLHIFAVVIMGVALIMPASRGGMLSLLAIIVFLTVAAFFLRRAELLKRDAPADKTSAFLGSRLGLLSGGLALIIGLIGAALFLGGEESLLRITGITYTGDEISNGRWHFWQTTWQMIRDNFLIGIGLDAFSAVFPRYDTWNGVYRLERAHNDYLQILAETGIFGLLLVLTFIALLFRRGLQIFASTQDRFRRGVALGALAGCLGILLHSFFDFPLHTPSNLLTFLILVALATVTVRHPKVYRRK